MNRSLPEKPSDNHSAQRVAIVASCEVTKTAQQRQWQWRGGQRRGAREVESRLWRRKRRRRKRAAAIARK
jgi:hypothetical protein